MAKYRKGNLEVEAAQFVPTAPIPTWVVEVVRPWSEAGYQPRDGSWGFIQQHDDRVHVFSGDWVAKFPSGRIELYKDSAFQHMCTPLQWEEVKTMDQQEVEVKTADQQEVEINLVDIIEDLQIRLTQLEIENHKLYKEVGQLHAHVYRPPTSMDYEVIHQEVMKRTARDLRLKTGAKDRA